MDPVLNQKSQQQIPQLQPGLTPNKGPAPHNSISFTMRQWDTETLRLVQTFVSVTLSRAVGVCGLVYNNSSVCIIQMHSY